MTTPTRTVTIGDTTVDVRPFRGYKAVNVGRLVADVMKLVPDLMDRIADFTREYEQRHAVRITREMAAAPQYAGLFANLDLSDEDWKGIGGEVVLPVSPNDETVMAAMFPIVFEQAEGKVVTLLAWIVVGNDELREADEADNVAAVIAAWEKRLLHEADLDQLLEVALVGADVIREQFSGKGDKLAQAIGQLTGRQAPSSKSSSGVAEASPTTSDPSGMKPDSSTSTPSTTSGREPQPSTA